MESVNGLRIFYADITALREEVRTSSDVEAFVQQQAEKDHAV